MISLLGSRVAPSGCTTPAPASHFSICFTRASCAAKSDLAASNSSWPLTNSVLRVAVISANELIPDLAFSCFNSSSLCIKLVRNRSVSRFANSNPPTERWTSRCLSKYRGSECLQHLHCKFRILVLVGNGNDVGIPDRGHFQ